MKTVKQAAEFPQGPGWGAAAVSSETGHGVTSPPSSLPEEGRRQGKHVDVESSGSKDILSILPLVGNC